MGANLADRGDAAWTRSEVEASTGDIAVSDSRRQRDVTDQQLIEKIRDGDAASLDELIHRYRRFALYTVRDYFLPGGTSEDLEQEALIGLFIAIRDFRPDKGIPFGGFADICIRRHVMTTVKNATRLKHRPLNGSVSLDQPGAMGEPTAHCRARPSAAAHDDPATLIISAETIESVRDQLTQELTDLEKDVLVLITDGKSYSTTAKVLDRHVKAIDNALQRARKKVLACFENAN